MSFCCSTPVPCRDTNETAHRLISRFGSLSSVFDAGIGELTDVEGISLNTAVLIKLIPALSRAYLLDRDTRYPSFRDPEKLGRYLVNSFIGCTGERLIAVYFNNRGECIGKTVVSEGTVNSTDIPVRKIAETGYRMKAAYFVLAHNHPDGDPIPSAEDISATETWHGDILPSRDPSGGALCYRREFLPQDNFGGRMTGETA